MSLPILDLAGAEPSRDASPLRQRLDLRLQPGELLVVHAPDREAARSLVELCAGLVPLAAGQVCFLGKEWANLPRREAEKLRGRIGLAPDAGAWMPHLDMEEAMILSRLHHGEETEAELLEEAARLARLFGFEGLPTGRPSALSRQDLARAAAARAFLGRPALVMLESPQEQELSDALVDPILAALDGARRHGAAALWCTRSRRAWEDPDFPATARLRLLAAEEVA